MDIQIPVKHPTCLNSISTWQPDGFSELYSVSCRYELENASLDDFRSFGLVLPSELESAVFSRQIEYLTGRYLAKVLLTNIDANATEVGRGSSRQPIWPDGLLGSISHSGSKAICVLGDSSQFEGLGVDIENYIDDATVAEIGGVTSSPKERTLHPPDQISESRLLTILFSAKESIFKALFPLVGRYFDFNDVEITHVDLSTQKFQAKLKVNLSERIKAGNSVHGSFVLNEDQVLTFVALQKGEI